MNTLLQMCFCSGLIKWKKKIIKNSSLFVNTNNNHLEKSFRRKHSGKITPVGKSMSFDHCHIFKAVPRY